MVDQVSTCDADSACEQHGETQHHYKNNNARAAAVSGVLAGCGGVDDAASLALRLVCDQLLGGREPAI